MYTPPEGVEVLKLEHIGKFTVAQVRNNRPGTNRNVKGVGVSRCSFLDRFNEERGTNIALGRACRALSKKENSELIHNPFMG